MMTAAQIQQLEGIYRQQIKIAAALHTVLHDENQALRQRDSSAMQQAVQEKERLTAEMEKISAQQQALLAAVALPASTQGLESLLGTLPDTSARGLRQLHKTLAEKLQECHEQNIVNGHIIAVNKQSAEAALAILRGQFPAENISYGAGGKPISGQSATSITKA